MTCDREAHRILVKEGAVAVDVFGLVITMVDRAMLSVDEAEEKLAPWDDKTQMRCRPRDWAGFSETLGRRRSQG